MADDRVMCSVCGGNRLTLARMKVEHLPDAATGRLDFVPQSIERQYRCDECGHTESIVETAPANRSTQGELQPLYRVVAVHESGARVIILENVVHQTAYLLAAPPVANGWKRLIELMTQP